jgi:hypothetical protein
MSMRGLFARKVPPLSNIVHPTLGTLTWSSQEKGWLGSVNGLSFCLAHEDSPEPSKEVVAYAEEMLRAPHLLRDPLEEQKGVWAKKYPAQATEISQLSYEQITFYRHKGKNQVFASLGPESANRSWRIEFQNHECKGLGFDS